MKPVPKKVWAVIVSWNGASWIQGALDSLHQSRYPVQSLVVDNASSDETVEIISSCHPDVELVKMGSNLGFGRANNQGISRALSYGADYVLLLNQDAKVGPETVEHLVHFMEWHPDFGIVSPLQLDYEGNQIASRFLPYLAKNARLISEVFFRAERDLYEVPFVPAAIWLLSRRMLEGVGGFDPLFFMGGEDNDLCNRARFHGFKVGIALRAVGCHFDGPENHTPTTIGTKTFYYYGQILRFIKAPQNTFFSNSIGVLSRWTRASIGNMAVLNFKDSLAITLALVKTTVSFYRIWQHYNLSKRQGSLWL